MGKRVHVVSKREEYGDWEAFNWKQEEFKNLLSALDCGVHEEDPDGYCDRWECEKEEYEQAIKNLKEYANGVTEGEGWIAEDVSDALHDLSYEGGVNLSLDPTSVIKIMEGFLSESDKECDWVIFVSW